MSLVCYWRFICNILWHIDRGRPITSFTCNKINSKSRWLYNYHLCAPIQKETRLKVLTKFVRRQKIYFLLTSLASTCIHVTHYIVTLLRTDVLYYEQMASSLYNFSHITLARFHRERSRTNYSTSLMNPLYIQDLKGPSNVLGFKSDRKIQLQPANFLRKAKNNWRICVFYLSWSVMVSWTVLYPKALELFESYKHDGCMISRDTVKKRSTYELS